jgi:hypothetical protein
MILSLIRMTRKQTRLEVYKRHLDRLERSINRLEEKDRRFFWIRLAALLLGTAVTFIGFGLGPNWLGPTLALASIGVFAFVVYCHRQVDASIIRFRIALELTSEQIARMNLDWEGIPLPPAAPPIEDHPFEKDLNMTGAHSIHQLIDAAVSRGGSDRLRDWLLASCPDAVQIQQRQAIVAEMVPLAGFRRNLALGSALVARDPRDRWDGERLLNWLDARATGNSLRTFLILLTFLGVANLALFLLNLLALIPPIWVFSLIAYALFYYYKYQDHHDLFEDAYYLSETLSKFRAVMLYLETYPYKKQSHLAGLCEPFWHPKTQPSRYLRRIIWIASAASLQKNQFFWFLLNAVAPWDLYLADRLQQYKKEMKSRLPDWLDTWYKLEAFNSLANFAYLNPDYVFPDLRTEVRVDGGSVFNAQDLGHPLITDDERITNDFNLDRLGGITLITGSNMSGKSTFLRTVGVNLCLTYAGGPVNATSMRITPFRLFTSINVSDSLSDGISYFYAEVRRLKALLEQLEREHPFPLFFLIDEIFRGTNNREREIGARAYVRALVGGNGVGVISTHDLELVKLEDELPDIRNCHFREEVIDGRMVFDYRLRAGPCPTTNALKIMSMEGLPVETLRAAGSE